MAKTKALISLRPHHPSGQFRKHGLTITEAPKVYTLDEEQVKFFASLPFLMVKTKAETLARFEEDPSTHLLPETNAKPPRTKADIIAALTAKGLLEGQDFEPDATNAALLALLAA